MVWCWSMGDSLLWHCWLLWDTFSMQGRLLRALLQSRFPTLEPIQRNGAVQGLCRKFLLRQCLGKETQILC